MAFQNLSMRISETISESTRDINFIGRSPNAEYFDAGEDKLKKIKKQLDSTSEREVLDAIKRLIALISKGRNVSEFFPQVVKNVGSHNLEIRKLVYIYLIRYADIEPDLALLSINTFQKDLSDHSPLIRAMALRVLSSIRVPIIGSIVVLGIKKCASDTSPYVRKAAALAIPKAYDLDPSHLGDLMPILQTLLRDRSPLSIGAVAVAFNAICPTRLDLLHQQYRRFCRILTDVDEWGQVQILDLLSSYARRMLRPPRADVPDLDPDLRLLLDSAEPLFHSRNPAVTLSVIRIFYYLGPPSSRAKVVSPLLNLAHRAPSPEMERVVLSNCSSIASDSPELLRKYISRFIVRANDAPEIKKLKVEVLVDLANADNVDFLIDEFKEYATDADDGLVKDSIHAIGRCARKVATAEAIERCSVALMGLMRNKHDSTVGHAILVLQTLCLQQTPSSQLTSTSTNKSFSPHRIIATLARRFDSMRHPSARASVLWLVGQYARADIGTNTSTVTLGADGSVIPGIHDWAPDVLRKVAKSFGEESEAVQLQALTLAAKLLVLAPPSPSASAPAQKIVLLARYVFAQAARVPISPSRLNSNSSSNSPSLSSSSASALEVRDRARTLGALLRGVDPELYKLSALSERDVERIQRAVSSLRLGSSGLRGQPGLNGVIGVGVRDEYEVSNEDWEKAMEARSGDDEGMPAEEGESGSGSGGVTLRVEQVRLVLFEGNNVSGFSKGPTANTNPASNYPLGTMGAVLGRSLYGSGDRVLSFAGDADGTDSSLRDSPEDAPTIQPQLQGFGNSNTPSAIHSSTTATTSRPPSSMNSASARARDILAPVESPASSVAVQDATTEKRKKWEDLDAFYAEEEGEDDDDDEEEEEDSGSEEGEEESTEEEPTSEGAGQEDEESSAAEEDEEENGTPADDSKGLSHSGLTLESSGNESNNNTNVDEVGRSNSTVSGGAFHGSISASGSAGLDDDLDASGNSAHWG